MNVQGTIPVAVVGAGRMGSHHARLYHEIPGAELVAVVDPDEARAAELAGRFDCAALADADALLARYPRVAAVSIATPTATHENVAGPLLERGIACLIEKPLAASVAEAQRLVARARHYSALVQVGHTERFNPAVQAIGDLQITPRFVEVDRVSPMSFRSIDIGVVFDLMIHDLDIVLMMCRGRLESVRAVGVTVLGEHEDVASARLEFSDGCVANLTASRLAMKTERKLRVFSESAYISLDYGRRTGVILHRTANSAALEEVRRELSAGADLSELDYTKLVNVEPITIGDTEPLRAELDNFLESVAGRAEPAVNAEAGCAAVEAAERVVDTLRAHTWEGLGAGRVR